MGFLNLANWLLVLSFPWLAFQAHAQVDASSQFLLRASEPDKPDATGLESGRYKVRLPKKPSALPSKKVRGSSYDNSVVQDQGTTVVLPQAKADKPLPLKPDQKALDLDRALFTPTEEPVVKPSSEPVPEAAVEPPPVTDQVKDLVLGNGQPAVEAYKEQIHPDDIRLNRLEINVAPGVIADNSKSNYSFRNYSSFSPKVLLGADFWMTPFLGVYGSYTTSLGADIAGDGATNSRVPVQHEWSEVGFHVRRFFGMSRKSNSLQFGIHISEYKFNVPIDDLHRVKLKSNGIGLHLLTRVPVAASYSWIFGGKIIPRLQHSESGTGIDASSGSSGESSRVDLFLGGELKLQRQNQITWDLTFSFEKNQFSGPVSLNDPETGTRPTGVSVQNLFTIFSMGYRWGQ